MQSQNDYTQHKPPIVINSQIKPYYGRKYPKTIVIKQTERGRFLEINMQNLYKENFKPKQETQTSLE